MFSGFLLFSQNLDFIFLNKIVFSGTLCAVGKVHCVYHSIDQKVENFIKDLYWWYKYYVYTGGPRILRILGHQGIVLLQKSY